MAIRSGGMNYISGGSTDFTAETPLRLYSTVCHSRAPRHTPGIPKIEKAGKL